MQEAENTLGCRTKSGLKVNALIRTFPEKVVLSRPVFSCKNAVRFWNL